MKRGDLGRSCNHHSVCGDCIYEGMILHVRCAYAYRNGRACKDLLVYLVEGGRDTCKVGFIAKIFEDNATALDNKYIKVMDVYSERDVLSRRTIMHQYCGFAKGVVTDELGVPILLSDDDWFNYDSD